MQTVNELLQWEKVWPSNKNAIAYLFSNWEHRELKKRNKVKKVNQKSINFLFPVRSVSAFERNFDCMSNAQCFTFLYFSCYWQNNIRMTVSHARADFMCHFQLWIKFIDGVTPQLLLSTMHNEFFPINK